jgi:hypothetical protein
MPALEPWELSWDEVTDIIAKSKTESVSDVALAVAKAAQLKLTAWQDDRCKEHPIGMGKHFARYYPRRMECLECHKRLRKWLQLKELLRSDRDEFAERRLPRLPRVHRGPQREK